MFFIPFNIQLLHTVANFIHIIMKRVCFGLICFLKWKISIQLVPYYMCYSATHTIIVYKRMFLYTYGSFKGHVTHTQTI